MLSRKEYLQRDGAYVRVPGNKREDMLARCVLIFKGKITEYDRREGRKYRFREMQLNQKINHFKILVEYVSSTMQEKG